MPTFYQTRIAWQSPAYSPLGVTVLLYRLAKGVGCNYATRVVRSVEDTYIKNGSTANLCAIDLSKAFDKVNHYALYLKLMKRLIPHEILNLLEFWLSACYSCVK